MTTTAHWKYKTEPRDDDDVMALPVVSFAISVGDDVVRWVEPSKAKPFPEVIVDVNSFTAVQYQ